VQTCDVLVVGGGPAGSSAAWKLKAAGADVLVLDRESFPRLKLCAGWITPDVVSDLEMDVGAYPHRFLTFQRLHFHVKGVHVAAPSVQHSIRRYEFDAWLLERSGAAVVRHNVRHIRREPGGYVVDDAFRCRWIVGAGGTSCPVYRTFFREVNPRAKELQAVALEHELPFDWRDPDCHLWFFDRGLPGYSWYVPKADGWLNLGVGGMAARLKLRGEDIKQHWAHFAKVVGRDLAKGAVLDPAGYSYWLLGNVDVVRVDDAFITGDAAGLATRDMCEGIGPAIRSGIRAAESILTGRRYDVADVTGASLGGGLVTRVFDWAFTRGVGRPGRQPRASAVVPAAS
jgi:flavin-dependent dehydrogenase